MIEIRPICAIDGRARKFILYEGEKQVLELTTNRMMTPDQLRATLAPKEVKEKRKRSR